MFSDQKAPRTEDPNVKFAKVDANLENLSKLLDSVSQRLDAYILKDAKQDKPQAQQPSIQVKQSMKEPATSNSTISKQAELEAELKGIKRDLEQVRVLYSQKQGDWAPKKDLVDL